MISLGDREHERKENKDKISLRLFPILPNHSPGITVVPVITVEERQAPVAEDRHEVDTKVEVAPGSVCTLAENVVTTTVEVTVVNKVRVGVGVHAAIDPVSEPGVRRPTYPWGEKKREKNS